MSRHTRAAEYADRIEAELRRIGAWRDEPPPPEAFESRVAFHGDTMSFEQWLQWVLLVRIRQIVASKGNFPAKSQVGTYAVRELDGDQQAGELVSLLAEFDQFIEEGA